MHDSLRGREVVLAGGSGGIGSAVTTRLIEEGARVILSYRSNRERAIRWESTATVIQADLAIPADRSRLLGAAPAIYGLVVLAGDPVRLNDPAAAMQRSHDANYLGPILLARECVERMRQA